MSHSLTATATENLTRRRGLVAACLIGFVLTKLALLATYAVATRYVTDEYHQGGHSAYIPLGFYDGFMPDKTVLYAYFYGVAHWLGGSAVEVMQLARLETLALAGLTLIMLYRIARRMGRERLESLFAVAVALSFSTFIERVFRVRSEPLATFFAVSALLVVIGEKRISWRILLSGVLCGAAFLTTQKAVYFDIAMGLALVGDGLMRKSTREALRAGALLTAGWAASVLVYSVYFRGADFFIVLEQIVRGPAALALDGGSYYEGLYRFILQTLAYNPVAYVLCVGCWAMKIPQLAELSRAERIVWLFTGITTFFVFNHNQPWPYIFVMAIPFLSLWSAELPRMLPRVDEQRRTFLVVVALAVLLPSFIRNFVYLGFDNRLQIGTVQVAETLLQPDDAYCDGVGMVVTRPLAGPVWWDQMEINRILHQAVAGDDSAIEHVLADNPKLWILNERTQRLAPVLRPIFAGSYVRILPNILLTGAVIEPNKPVRFHNRWPGEYRLYDLNGQPITEEISINGRAAVGSFRLEKGTQALRMHGDRPAVVLPVGVEVPFSIPVRREPALLFEAVYG